MALFPPLRLRSQETGERMGHPAVGKRCTTFSKSSYDPRLGCVSRERHLSLASQCLNYGNRDRVRKDAGHVGV